MPRQKSTLPPFEWNGSYTDALDAFSSGEYHGVKLTSNDAMTILKHFTGRNGTLTQHAENLKNRLNSCENRSAEKASVKRSLVSVKFDIAELRNAAERYRTNLSIRRAENSVNREEKTIGNTKSRFVRAYRSLVEIDPEWINEFMDDPINVGDLALQVNSDSDD